ncbi:Dihydrofolate reductase [Seinonella peptonophila]|uniref:Dihydrofolate reductase n=1 Tax=Seinonella peptonophila TaxID=112248 RepID=A0A1M5ABI4_9BACL|nr:dihydrofolate reductase family protein [Seinonella peptonophila]SHF27467.1 Dihydrofolate reductase [Seinonella peptonophila]
MGRINLTMQMSLDGIVSNEDQWMMLSEEILEDYFEYYKRVDTIVVGGNTYFSMAEHWQHAEEFSSNSLERSLAQYINRIPKIVISHSELDLVWRNSQQIIAKDSQFVISEVEKLKNDAEFISVESGVKTWQLFIRDNLFDDLWILVHPIVVSQGERLFSLAEKQSALNLMKTKTYKNGVLGLYYKK